MPAGKGEPAAAAARIRQRPAAVREAIVAALDEWDELASNPQLGIPEPHREWLRAVLDAAESQDAWTRQARAARREPDARKRQAALAVLAQSADATVISALALIRLANQLPPDQATQLLRRAQHQYPADFWVNHDLGFRLRMLTPPNKAEAIRFLTAAVALRPDSPGCIANLGNALSDNGQVDEAIACHQKAIDLDPKLAPAHSNLGNALKARGQVDEAIACYHKAIDLDPKLAMAHSNLGDALRLKGQVDEALVSCKKALALDPRLAMAHNNLGLALQRKGQMDEAIACYEKAIALDPKDAVAHSNLGVALAGKGQVDEAIACYKKALTLDSKDAASHSNLGAALLEKGQVDEAIACYKKAIALDSKFALAHTNLGIALAGKGQLDEAIACFQKAIEINPKLVQPHIGLGGTLLEKGRFLKARDATARALELLPEKHPLRELASRQLQTCERLLKLEARLPRLLTGEDQPASAQENLELATMCRTKQRYAAAARFADDAFDAGVAQTSKRCYAAAACAVLAADGKGTDAAQLSDKEKAALRKQALGWLNAALQIYRQQLKDKAQRAQVQQTLRHWQKDADLGGLRAPKELARLAAAERVAWQQIWTEVAELLKKAETPAKAEDKP
jgi:tetratricopeptide (TPR) repeat protein